MLHDKPEVYGGAKRCQHVYTFPDHLVHLGFRTLGHVIMDTIWQPLHYQHEQTL